MSRSSPAHELDVASALTKLLRWWNRAPANEPLVTVPLRTMNPAGLKCPFSSAVDLKVPSVLFSTVISSVTVSWAAISGRPKRELHVDLDAVEGACTVSGDARLLVRDHDGCARRRRLPRPERDDPDDRHGDHEQSEDCLDGGHGFLCSFPLTASVFGLARGVPMPSRASGSPGSGATRRLEVESCDRGDLAAAASLCDEQDDSLFDRGKLGNRQDTPLAGTRRGSFRPANAGLTRR